MAVVPGSSFGSPDAIRISFATSEKVITNALKRISGALAAIKRK